MSALAFDIGGTYIRFALVGRSAIVRPVVLASPGSYHGVLSLIKKQAIRLFGGQRCRLVIGGIAGPLNAKKTGLAQSTHLPFFVGKNLQRDIARFLRTRVLLENDNALAGLGETRFGAGKPYRIVAYIGIGTGIGGSRCVDGRLDQHAFGFEPGHHILALPAQRHGYVSQDPGDWESFVSGSAVQKRFGLRAEHLKNRLAWKGLARATAYGLVNVAVFWSPNVIVLGGSLMKTLSITEIRHSYRRLLRVFPVRPKILAAKLGDFGALYGALVLSQQLGQGRGDA